ncbi:MAG TPA: SUMF1/EgtB/PvdO family nonheme iron enzyme, partial [Myxococcota bacterium]|nr:SUMF1/EgtB/PvdO family nonheme iron enzyme [Myxococcota bacterium]
DYPSGSVTDPTGPSTGSFRVGRGGSWDNSAGRVRAAYRRFDDPGYRGGNLGLRLARSVR